jgi:hypothetical protein cdivTM_09436
MNNHSNILFPEIISEAFPILDDASYIRQLASLTPLCPDTIFHLFANKGGQYFALVMTDYPDPLDQSRELEQISGEYEFEFVRLIKPYANDQHIEVRPNDDMDDGFFVPDPKSYYRYYLAAAKQKLD